MSEPCLRCTMPAEVPAEAGSQGMCSHCGTFYLRCGNEACRLAIPLDDPTAQVACACGWRPSVSARLVIESGAGKREFRGDECVALSGDMLRHYGLARSVYECMLNVGFLVFNPARRQWMLGLRPGVAEAFVQVNGSEVDRRAGPIPLTLPVVLRVMGVTLNLSAGSAN